MLPIGKDLQKRIATILMVIGFFIGIFAFFLARGAYNTLRDTGFLGAIWSPDSEYIVVSVYTDENHFYSIDAATGDMQEVFVRDDILFGDYAVDDYWHVAAWTEDGHHLVGHPVGEEIIVADVTDGSQTKITANDSDEYGVAVSPTGSHVAYWVYGSRQGEPYTLHITDLASKEDIHVVQKPYYSPTLLAWASDGSQLAYWNRQDDETTTSLMAYDLETGESHTILEESEAAPRELSWSPDGAWMTYWTHPADGWGSLLYVDTNLYVVDVQTGEQKVVAGPIAFFREHYLTPIFWSPDSSRFAFSENSHAYIIDPAEGTLQMVDRHNLDRDQFAIHIGWQGDALLVTYSDGGRERVVDGEVTDLLPSADPLTFLAPDGMAKAELHCESDARPLPALNSDGKPVIGCRNFDLTLSKGADTKRFTVRDFTNDDEISLGFIAATVLSLGGGFWLYRSASRRLYPEDTNVS